MRKSPFNTAKISIFLFFLYVMFADLFDRFLPSIIRLLLWIITIILFAISKPKSAIFRINKNTALVSILTLFFLFYNNVGLKNGVYMTVAKFIFFSLFAFLLCYSNMHHKRCVKYIASFGLIHVFATYLFFFLPRLYSKMYFVWGRWPGGSGRGAYGYRAALSDHYSGNGMMLALTSISLFSFIISYKDKSQTKAKKIYIILFLVAFFAVILTTKRAHLLFGVVAMIIVYYYCNPEKIHSRGFKIIVAGLIAIPVIYFISSKVPLIQAVFNRFHDLDEDGHMLNRYKMWEIAWNMFLKKPLLGNGWSSFRFALFDSYLGDKYGYMNAHNVYIQLLAEVGIIGFIIYMSVLIYLMWIAFKLLRIYNKINYYDPEISIPLYFSATFLVFYTLYSFTGNCFYDKMEPFYFVAGAIVLGNNKSVKSFISSYKSISPNSITEKVEQL